MMQNNGDIKVAVLYGGTGQAKVVRPILEQQGIRVIAVFDDTPNLQSPFSDIQCVRCTEEIDAWLAEHQSSLSNTGFCITIGNPHGLVRCQLHDKLSKLGMKPLQAIHSSAIIEANAVIGEGCQIMAGAYVGVEAHLGRQCIVNTMASVDHECKLAEGVELAPGATLCGLINLGKYAWVGAGATVLPRVSIGENAVIGAGSLVRKDVVAGETVVGVPASPLA